MDKNWYEFSIVLVSLENESFDKGSIVYFDNDIMTIEEIHNESATIVNREGNMRTVGFSLLGKVIAFQSQLSPWYIQQFINEYNKGEVKDIRIEMEEYTDGNGMYRNSKMFQPKLTNGFVTIVEKLQMPKISADDLPLSNGGYTEEEVIKLLEKAFIKAASYAGFISYYGLMPKKYAKEWFEQNKKE
jgi:hypothetical protein